MDTIDVLRGSLALLILMSGAAVVAAIVVLLRSIARNAGAIIQSINRVMPSKTASLTKRGPSLKARPPSASPSGRRIDRRTRDVIDCGKRGYG
jgi:hypothetical protein